MCSRNPSKNEKKLNDLFTSLDAEMSQRPPPSGARKLVQQSLETRRRHFVGFLFRSDVHKCTSASSCNKKTNKPTNNSLSWSLHGKSIFLFSVRAEREELVVGDLLRVSSVSQVKFNKEGLYCLASVD